MIRLRMWQTNRRTVNEIQRLTDLVKMDGADRPSGQRPASLAVAFGNGKRKGGGSGCYECQKLAVSYIIWHKKKFVDLFNSPAGYN